MQYLTMRGRTSLRSLFVADNMPLYAISHNARPLSQATSSAAYLTSTDPMLLWCDDIVSLKTIL